MCLFFWLQWSVLKDTMFCFANLGSEWKSQLRRTNPRSSEIHHECGWCSDQCRHIGAERTGFWKSEWRGVGFFQLVGSCLTSKSRQRDINTRITTENLRASEFISIDKCFRNARTHFCLKTFSPHPLPIKAHRLHRYHTSSLDVHRCCPSHPT